jgi:lipid II:glycine glycyltransferase (peptidoglycan interpeptide bridge formation enzyme)
MIRKAQKNGVTIRHGRDPELFESFRSIYNSTMDKDHAQAYYYFDAPFYQSIHDDLAEHAEIFYAVWEDRIIAASIMLACNGKMNYHLSGSLREYANLAPSNLLLYEAALWGCANGCKTLYLGGGVGSGEDSLFKFKRAFYRGEDLLRFHIGKKIFDRERYDTLVSLRDDLPESGFFPRYRA